MYTLYYKYVSSGYTYEMLIFFSNFLTSFAFAPLLFTESRRFFMKNLQMDKSVERHTFAQMTDKAREFLKYLQ